jgi:hypothetical protein
MDPEDHARSRRKLRASSVKLRGAPLYLIELSMDEGRTWQLVVTPSVRVTRAAAKEQGWKIRAPKAPRFV